METNFRPFNIEQMIETKRPDEYIYFCREYSIDFTPNTLTAVFDFTGGGFLTLSRVRDVRDNIEILSNIITLDDGEGMSMTFTTHKVVAEKQGDQYEIKIYPRDSEDCVTLIMIVGNK